VTLSTDSINFIVVVSMNVLPFNTGHENLKQFIQDNILNVNNKDLVANDPAMKVVIKMGFNLAINAFAVNFRKINKGQLVVNQDVVKVNNLEKCIFEHLSISKVTDSIPSKLLILISTQFTQDSYKFKQTLTALLANKKYKAIIDKGLPPSDG
jgi:hypothetical protein